VGHGPLATCPKCWWPIFIILDAMKYAMGRDVINKVIVAAALEKFTIWTESDFWKVIKCCISVFCTW